MKRNNKKTLRNIIYQTILDQEFTKDLIQYKLFVLIQILRECEKDLLTQKNYPSSARVRRRRPKEANKSEVLTD